MAAAGHTMSAEAAGEPGPAVAGSFLLHFEVPDDFVSLAAELDEEAAAAEHAKFVDAVLRPGAPPAVRAQMLAQLAAARIALIGGGIRYFCMAGGNVDGRQVLLMVGIAVTPFPRAEGEEPRGLLARMLREQYPQDAALVEEFGTEYGPGVGLRRAETLPFPVPGGQPLQIDTGVAQAIIHFLDAGAAGVVTGYCFSPRDIDTAAVTVALIARRMTITRQGHQPRRLATEHG